MVFLGKGLESWEQCNRCVLHCLADRCLAFIRVFKNSDSSPCSLTQSSADWMFDMGKFSRTKEFIQAELTAMSCLIISKALPSCLCWG